MTTKITIVNHGPKAVDIKDSSNTTQRILFQGDVYQTYVWEGHDVSIFESKKVVNKD